MLATQSPRMPLATETGERCFTSPKDQLGQKGTLLLLNTFTLILLLANFSQTS